MLTDCAVLDVSSVQIMEPYNVCCVFDLIRSSYVVYTEYNAREIDFCVEDESYVVMV